ncbi:glycosyltransferase family 4 protein [Streptomyces klenkii]|uniref:glycosyltransferase family 4 protein n=1 Tax=Streptomyces klenkii TaxID=1420899 RepID=UPI0034332C9D
MNRSIFLVCNSIDELGGVTTWAHQMARLFTERGHRVHLIGITPSAVPHETGARPPYKTTTLYEVHPPKAWSPHAVRDYVNIRAYRRQSRRHAEMQKRADRLSVLFRSAEPGGVIIVTQVWAMEWVNLADTSGLTMIGMTHESFEACRQSSRFRRVKLHYKDVDRLLTLTREDADLWIRQGMNNIGFMPNALPWTPETSSERSGKIAVTVARLSQEKGIDILLDAWALAVEENPSWRLRIYGKGDGEELLTQQCARLGLENSVQWMGKTSDVRSALNSASLFALPSRAEGFPLTLLEAMASGMPCVAFDVAPGVREIIQDGEDGLLVPPGNVTAFAEQLKKLMRDQRLRNTMGERGRINIQRYSADKITCRWEELFELLER